MEPVGSRFHRFKGNKQTVGRALTPVRADCAVTHMGPGGAATEQLLKHCGMRTKGDILGVSKRWFADDADIADLRAKYPLLMEMKLMEEKTPSRN